MQKCGFRFAAAALAASFLGLAYGEPAVISGGDWAEPSNWSIDRLPTAADEVTVRGKVTSSGRDAINVASLEIESGASLCIGAHGLDAHPSLQIAGDFTMKENSSLSVYPGPIDESHTFITGGATVSVGGKATFLPGATVYPYVHGPANMYTRGAVYDKSLCTGAPVVFSFGSFDLREGASFNADGKGYGLFSTSPVSRPANFVGATRVGAGYGGEGGKNIESPSDVPFATYGFRYAPLMPGSPGGSIHNIDISVGGGAIRISVEGNADIAGTLTANGAPVYNYTGGGSGGAIFVSAGLITLGDSARLSANGATAYAERHHPKGGGGGGGRIALAMGLSDSQLSQVYAEQNPSSVVEADLVNFYPWRVFVDGGFGGTHGYPESDGKSGTAVFYWNSTQSAPVPWDYVYLDGETRKMLYSSSVSEDKLVCTWIDERKIGFDALPGGSVSANSFWIAEGASSPAVSAMAESGYRFAYWMGDITDEERYSNPLSLVAKRPRSVKAVFAAETPASYTWSRGGGAAGEWHDPTSWTPAGIPGPEDSVRIAPVGGKMANVRVLSYAKAANIEIEGWSNVEVGNQFNATGATAADGTGNPTRNGIVGNPFPIGLESKGGISLKSGAVLAVGGDRPSDNGSANTLSFSGVKAGGDIILEGASSLLVYAGATNVVAADLFENTGIIEAAGKIKVGAGAKLVTAVNYATEGHVLVKAPRVEIDEGGTIHSDGLGGKNYIEKGGQYIMPWPPYSLTVNYNADNAYYGGTHGGLGGNTSSGQYALRHAVYGYENTPVNVGMQGGNNNPRGGGIVHIDAGTVVLDGTVRANGLTGGWTGGSAGGSVWINCEKFSASATSAISVRGGDRISDSRIGASGTGAGGRAAVTVGFTPEELVLLRSSDSIEGKTILSEPLQNHVASFSAEPGSLNGFNGGTGQPGTGKFLANTTGKLTLAVEGTPSNFSVVEPPYGMNTYASGTEVAVSAPGFVPVPGEEGLSRRKCMGWRLIDAAGEVLASGAGNTGSFVLTANARLVWDYAHIQYSFKSSAFLQGGTVSMTPSEEWVDAGETVAFEAIPEEGYSFMGWKGGAFGCDRKSPRLEIPASCARDLKAVFASDAASDKRFKGAIGASWLDDASWDPEGIPGKNSRVYVTNNDAQVFLDCPFPYDVSSLAIGKSAYVRVGNSGNDVFWTPVSGEDYLGDVTGFRISGDLVLDGKLSIGGYRQLRDAVLSVGGNLLMTNSASQFGIYAGRREESLFAIPSTYKNGGGRVNVTGEMRLSSGARLYPVCDIVSGVTVIIKAGIFNLEEGAQVSAKNAGPIYTLPVHGIATFSPGSPALAVMAQYYGSSYGGKGGGDRAGPLYGKDFAPYYAGSVPGNRAAAYDGFSNRSYTAAGAVRIDARKMRLHGSVTADGANGNTFGGSSGGGIFLSASHFDFGENGLVSAAGGNNFDRKNTDGYAGGGGRIAIVKKEADSDIDRLYDAETLPKSFRSWDLVTAKASTPVLCAVSVAGGQTPEAYPQCAGSGGTALYIVAPSRTTMLLLR